eukprot:g20594.t1
MKSPPSPPPSQDDAPLPGLGLSPRTGAHSTRRVRSLPPKSKRASCADPINQGTGSDLPGGRSGSGSDCRLSPLLDAKEKGPCWGHSDPAVENGARGRGRGVGGSGRGRSGSGGGGVEVAEAKQGRNEGGQDHLPATKPTTPTHDGVEGRRRSSHLSSLGAERPAQGMGVKTTKSLSSVNGIITNDGDDSFPACSDHVDGQRYTSSHRNEEKEKDAVVNSSSSNSSMPNSPSTARGATTLIDTCWVVE